MKKIDNSCKEVMDKYGREVFQFFTSEYEQACKRYNRISQFRREKRHYYPPYKFQTPNGFNFVIFFFTRGRNEPEAENTGDLVYAWYRYKDKIYAITTHQMCDYPSVGHLSVFIPHFFYRYRDRFLQKPQMKILEVMQHFFLSNYRQGMKYVPSKKYPNCIYNFSDDGVCFANTDNPNYMEYKTYVTWQMLFPDQREVALEVKMSAEAHMFDLAIPEDEFDDIE